MRIGPGAATAYQHDAQELPNGQISIFDNGGNPMVHPQSRAIVLGRPGKRTRCQRSSPPQADLAGSQGNMQSLEKGDFFVGWGRNRTSPSSRPRPGLLRRAPAPREPVLPRLPLPLEGPPRTPAIAVGEQGEGTPRVRELERGHDVGAAVCSPEPSAARSPLATAPARGETAIEVPGAPAYVALQALDGAGNVLGASGTIKG